MRRAFYLTVGLMLTFLVLEAGRYAVRREVGQSVRLAVVPVDPRSLFMGQYMNLSFDVSQLEPSLFDSPVQPGQVAWVGLRPGEPSATPVRATLRPPRPPRDGLVYLRGKVQDTSSETVRMEYGIERYYIPETRQQDVIDIWNRRGAGSTVVLEAALDSSGQAAIKRLLVDGEPLEF